jgi:hypothetical protein
MFKLTIIIKLRKINEFNLNKFLYHFLLHLVVNIGVPFHGKHDVIVKIPEDRTVFQHVSNSRFRAIYRRLLYFRM